MSGYAGIVRTVGTGDATADDARRIEEMAAAIGFRGPDASQVWHHPDVHFCFSLLKTGPAPQAASQPCSFDGRVWLLGDVRLDGRDEVGNLGEVVGRVRVGHHDDVALGGGKPRAQRAAVTTTRLVDDPGTGGFGHLAGPVGGAVVHDDHFADDACSRQGVTRFLDAQADRVGFVEAGKHHRDGDAPGQRRVVALA